MTLYESATTLLLGEVTLLAEGDWLDGRVSLSPARMVQQVGLWQEDGARTWERGNFSHTVSWVVVRQHASPAAAHEWMLAHQAEIQALGGDETLHITIAGTEGSMTLAHASVTGVQCSTFEAFSRSSYVILGGELGGDEFTFP